MTEFSDGDKTWQVWPTWVDSASTITAVSLILPAILASSARYHSVSLLLHPLHLLIVNFMSLQTIHAFFTSR